MESTVSTSLFVEPAKSEPGSTPGFSTLAEKTALVLILLLAAFLRFWNLSQNGTGNPYYAAAVRSMLMSWHNFFFVSFDPAGFVSVDKPPVALWLQALSARWLGYSGFSLILPQVLEGCASVALVYGLVRRRFEAGAALLAALVMALGPVCVAVDRYNNVDSCLILVLLLSAGAMSLAFEKGELKYLLAAMALAGVGFNTKMMAAFIILPVFYALYFFTAPLGWKRRTGHLLIASLVLAFVSLSWPLAVDLTPPSQRPYVGSSRDNSMIGLSLGWNGFQRLLNRGRGFGKDPGPLEKSGADQAGVSTAAGIAGAPGRERNGRMGMGAGDPGPFRLTEKQMAGQFAWLLPLGLAGLGAAFRQARSAQKLRWAPAHQALGLWVGWLSAYALVLSFMQGAMHTYYLVLLMPATAALTGIGAWAFWKECRTGGKKSNGILTAVLALTAAWQSFIVVQYPDWRGLILPMVWILVGIAVAGLWVSHSVRIGLFRSWAAVFFAMSLVGLLICPALWALTPVVGDGNSVEANPDLLTGEGARTGFRRVMNSGKLLAFLEARARGEKYLLAAPNSQLISSIIIQTGKPLVALGGFMGSDPIVTAAQFAQMVRDGDLRYLLIQESGSGGRRVHPAGRPAGWGGPRGGFQADIVRWAKAHGKPVKKSLWWSDPPSRRLTQSPRAIETATGGWTGGGRRNNSLVLYDLRPSVSP